MRILRPKDAARALGIRKDTLYNKFVRTGRIRWVKISDKAVGVPEDELNALIEQMRAQRDAEPFVGKVRGGRFAQKQAEKHP